MGALGGAIAGGIGGHFGATTDPTRARGFSWGHEFNRALSHGIGQEAVGSLRGQKFGTSFFSGFAGSFAGSAFGNYLPKAHWSVSIGVSGTIGGFSSRISGGRFEDGFASAASVAVFNHIMHELSIKKMQADYDKMVERRNAWFKKYEYTRPFPLTADQEELLMNYEAAEIRSFNLSQATYEEFLGKLQTHDSDFFYRGRGASMRFQLSDGTIAPGGDLNYRLQGMMWAARGPDLIPSSIGMPGSNVAHNVIKRPDADWAKVVRVQPYMEDGYGYYRMLEVYGGIRR